MRTERDALGEKQIPDEAYYGVQTQRAYENFPISGIRSHREMVRAIGAVKLAAAETNMELGTLPKDIGEYIAHAAREVFEGKWDDHFVVDVFQAGAGTSFNMNANEVIANRSLEMMGHPRGHHLVVHPNDHVNMSQSTNDVFPTALRIAALNLIHKRLIPALKELRDAFSAKASEFDDVVKSGRTHLQDAVPVRLGQEFGGYASAVDSGLRSIEESARWLQRLNIGATALGTGLNAPPGYRDKVIKHIAEITSLPVHDDSNLFELTQSSADFGRVSSQLKTFATDLARIANDIRLLSSGPRTGLGEIVLPAVQPGSSIMPGKVNPSIAEMVDMVCFQVIGNDTTIALAVQAGQLDLNVMNPVIAYDLLQSIEILANASEVFARRCIADITADRDKCRDYAEKSVALVTILSPVIGYSKAAEVAKESVATGRSIREVVKEKDLMPEEELDRILDPAAMT